MIDFHVHVYPPEIIQSAEEISKTEPYFNALIHNKVHRWATVEDLIMNDSAVKRSVIFGFAFRDLGLCRICNDYVISAVRNYPEYQFFKNLSSQKSKRRELLELSAEKIKH